MAATTVIVQHHDGSPARNVKVSLGFDHGGVTKQGFTDNHGQATISHSQAGRATVYVSGSARTTVHCPCTVSVTV